MSMYLPLCTTLTTQPSSSPPRCDLEPLVLNQCKCPLSTTKRLLFQDLRPEDFFCSTALNNISSS